VVVVAITVVIADHLTESICMPAVC